MATPVHNSVPFTLDPQKDGLLQGSSWQFGGGPRQLTYSLSLNDTANGGQWSPELSEAVRDAFTQWENVADIKFDEVGSGTRFFESSADIAVTLTGDDLQTFDPGLIGLGIFPSPPVAESTYPNTVIPGTGVPYSRATWPRPEGDVFLDNYHSTFAESEPGEAGFEAILHEIGHALGLKHPHDYGDNGRPTFAELRIEERDSSRFTVMSYNSSPVATASSGNAATPMLLDIRAIQHIYGANMSFRTGDDTYTLSDDQAMRTIWDAGGIDTVEAFSASVDLRPGAVMSVGGLTTVFAIAYDCVIENVITHGMGSVTGNDADNVIDTSDSAINADTHRGGKGNDTYILDGVDQVSENAGEGTDSIVTPSTFTLGANVENLTLTGSGGYAGTGNALDNIIIGNGSTNRLQGGGGNDFLDGGAGIDVMVGGAGDDTYVVGDASPGAPPTGLLLAGDDGAFVYGGPPITRTPEDGRFDIFTVSDATGDGIVDSFFVRFLGDAGGFFTLTVSAAPSGQNLLPGSFPNATRFGGPDNPRLDFGFDGRGSNESSGNFTVHSIDVDYSATSPVLDSMSLSFELHSEGNVAATYGTFNWNAVAGPPTPEAVSEALDEGIDTVLSSIAYVLGANVEKLTLTGSAGISGRGNAAANTIAGNAADNILEGAGGNDILAGAGGNDTAVYTAAASQYSLLSLSNGAVVVGHTGLGADGIDQLTGVEHLRFAGGEVASSEAKPLYSYVASYADLIAALGANEAAALDHYLSHGCAEGRIATFDAWRYIASHADLIDALGADASAGARHYVAHGFAEGRSSSFDGLEYIASYGDLIQALGSDASAGGRHYVAHGFSEGRAASFDGLEYIASYADLIQALGANPDAGATHYIDHGHTEGRSTSFEGLRYIASHADLIQALGAAADAGTAHFINYGHAEGRSTSFNSAQYLANYADLQSAFGSNLRAATEHYIAYGFNEGRTDDVI